MRKPRAQTRGDLDLNDPRLPAGSDTLQTRSAATGQEAVYLTEAGVRLEAVAGVLAAAALDHIGVDDLHDALGPLAALVDEAHRLVDRAGGQQ